MTRLLPCLLSELRAIGYFSLYASFGDLNLRRHDWLRVKSKLDGDALLAWSLFLCGESIDVGQFKSPEIRNAIPRLIDYGVVENASDDLITSKFCLLSIFGVPFFGDYEALQTKLAGEVMRHFSSFAFLKKNDSCMYIGSDIGVESVFNGSRNGILVAPNVSRKLIECNSELLSTEMRVHEALDFNVQNSTALAYIIGFIEPAGINLPNFLSGGKDGNERLRWLLSEFTRTNLTAGNSSSELTIIGLGYGTSFQQYIDSYYSQFLNKSELGAIFTVTSRHDFRRNRGSFIFNLNIEQLCKYNGNRDFNLTTEALQSIAEVEGVDSCYMYTARIGPKRGISIVDLSDLYYGTWVV